MNGTNSTNNNGNATFSYFGNGGEGTDVIQACYADPPASDIFICAETVTKVWNLQTATSNTITLAPEYRLNLVGEDHTVNATVTNGTNSPVGDALVTFTVLSGPNAGVNGTDTTNAGGNATFTYTGSGGVGSDSIQACFQDGQNTVCSNVVEKEWTTEIISITPLLAQNDLNTEHTVNATVQDLLKGNRLSDIDVTFTVVAGPNTGDTGTNSTNATGVASFTYTGDGGVGTDIIEACFVNAAGEEVCSGYEGENGEPRGNNAYKEWGNTCPLFEVNPDELPIIVKDEFYELQHTIFGNATAPVVFEKTNGTLPDGLDLNGTAGILSGTPQEDGIFNFAITATDVNDCNATRDYELQICSTITLEPDTEIPADLARGYVGHPYSQSINADVNGTFVISGDLPPDLMLTGGPGNYAITGTPKKSGRYVFTITATTALGCTDTQDYRIDIIASIPTVSEWGMIILAFGLVVFSIMGIRRRGLKT